MSRKHRARQWNIEALEARSLLSVVVADDPTRQARLGAALNASRSAAAATAEVAVSPAAARAAAIQQKRLLQQQLRARGRIKSAVSLDSNTIEIRLKQRVGASLGSVGTYQIPGLTVESATSNKAGLVVTLRTSPQDDTSYTLTMVVPSRKGRSAASAAGAGATLSAMSAPQGQAVQTLGTITLMGTPPVISPSTGDLPRVVSATSTSNTQVTVQFSEPMSDRALVAQYYEITPQNVFAESGRLIVKNARFQEYGTGTSKVVDRSTVLLTTESQNEMDYMVRVAGMVDLSGAPMAPPAIVGGMRMDPTIAYFQGTPPQAEVKNGVPTLVDTDGDGLFDNEEQKGWQVTVAGVDGTVTTRTVTSDIRLADSDGDGLSDYQEANLHFDPRATDSDSDQIGDYAEFNELFSNGLDQDTDNDGLDDFVEFAFFKSSPLFADSDGDQLNDGDEINGNRNPLVSDLPRPEIEVGAINLQLDVRFSESNARESRDLETKTVSTTLSRSESQSLSRQYTGSIEAKLGYSYSNEYEMGGADGFKQTTTQEFNAEATAGFTFQQTEESASETQRSYEDSRTTESEVTSGFTLERLVVGAVMQATVNLRNVSNIAYRVKNLQVTAFIQDPLDRTRLTPVATLLPDSEPEEGFTLGPFVTNRGPLIFSNTTIVPTLVESLMANSAGLVFRISNYDIINEDGRNFAFVSQDVVERTGQLVLDFGGARSLRAKVSDEPIDENLPGDETEIHRVSTAQGRAIVDEDGDGTLNANPHVQVKAVDFTGGETLPYEDGGYATDTSGGEVVLDGGTISLKGNHFRAFEFPTTITPDSVLEFDFLRRGAVERLIAIGVDDDLEASGDRMFQVNHTGAPGYAIPDFADGGPYNQPIHVSIPIGQYPQFLGDNNYITFAFVDDYPDAASTTFQNIKISGTYGGDHRVTFDGAGKEVGVTLFDALAAVGLARYEARYESMTGRYLDYEPGGTVPVDTSTAGEVNRILNSYSTYIDESGREKIFRIRGVANDFGIKKYWEILTAQGIDQQTTLGDLVLKTDSPVSLNFVQDLDGDLLPADVEYLLRTVDSEEPVSGTDPTPKSRDTDGDGLDDRFEALIGWDVSTPRKTVTVHSLAIDPRAVA